MAKKIAIPNIAKTTGGIEHMTMMFSESERKAFRALSLEKVMLKKMPNPNNKKKRMTGNPPL